MKSLPELEALRDLVGNSIEIDKNIGLGEEMYTFTAERTPLFHTSNVNLFEEDINLNEKPLWMSESLSSALASGYEKAASSSDGEEIFIHIFEIKQGVQLVRLYPDAQKNAATLVHLIGLRVSV
jgi:hypothetical protein